MKRLFRILHWRARAKYWHVRALKAEGQLAAEMWRDRERSDMFATVQMRALGLFGMDARAAPAPTQKRSTPQQALTHTDENGMTWADQNEFDMFWWPDAQVAGISRQMAMQKFMQEVVIPRRSPLNDEPTM